MNEPVAWGPIVRRVAREAAWAPLTVLVAHAVCGRMLGHEPYVDPVMHLSGGVAAAFFFRQASTIAGDLLGEPSPTALDLLAFGLTCAMAMFWEFGEALAHRYLSLKEHIGAADTIRDLAFGVVGAVVYLGARRIAGRRGRAPMRDTAR